MTYSPYGLDGNPEGKTPDRLMADMLTALDWSRPYIEDALAYSGGTHRWPDIQAGVLLGNLQLWPGQSSAAVTEINVYPRKKVLNVFLAGGDMDELMVMMDSAREWGRSRGCDTMMMSGRQGWRRVLNKQGWSDLHSAMATEL